MLSMNFKKYIMLGLFVYIVSSILYSGDAYAVFENLTNTGGEIFTGMRKIIWGAAGFGILAVAIGGFFGVLNWKWLSAIIIGLVVISVTKGVLEYLAAGTGAKVDIRSISDTLKTGE